VNTEIDRFAEDLENSDQLCQELADFSGSFDDLAGWLNDKGYGINAGELAAIISAKLDGLSDEELDAVSGGRGGMESFDLQQNMLRGSNFLQMMSNISGKVSDSTDRIIRKIG